AVIASGAYSLDTSYHHMFLADNNTSPEIIFAIPFDGLRTQTWGGTTFLVHASVGGSMSANNYGIDGGWWGLRLKAQADSFYAAGDRRSGYLYTTGQTVDVSAIGDFTKGIAAPKFQNVTSTGAPGSNKTFPDTDFPVFRLGDAYLIYVEANLRGGGGSAATALTYLNAIRQRAYGNTTANFAALPVVDTLLAERGRELLWEAHRRTDLVRFGLFTGGTYLWQWKGGSHTGAATDAHLNIYPLPASELIANPNLQQNPGY
ncbi:MAG TPA: RagB/SusD family nutrient uptake outer membrane protein, partial [Gemmatimonadales bacterium]|nr:RagB/SusD family nutrient uptake outer membrane protein [Gemmatimonadales bacterium]